VGQLKGHSLKTTLAGIDEYKNGWVTAIELRPGETAVRHC